MSQRPDSQENHGHKREQSSNHQSPKAHEVEYIIQGSTLLLVNSITDQRDITAVIESKSTNTSAYSPPGTSASLARAGFLHFISNFSGTSLFLSSTLALRRRQGETLLSTKLLAPGKPGLFTVGPNFLQRDESETNVLYLLLGFSP